MRKKSKVINILKQHIKNNIKEYSTVILIFIIGIFLAVFFVNNIAQSQKDEINIYIKDYINNIKSIEKLDSIELLKISVWQNLVIAISIWFFGTTVIGVPVVFALILYRGFCLGYAISTSVLVLGTSQGLIFSMVSLLLQNILFIPAILGISVSGIKLYKSIVKDKRKENIKLEILRHTIFSIVMLVVIIVASIVEVFISTNILKLIATYL